eukprot:CAMPEP_0184983430 /NCGR_PEP_ID=MMETSP1098-20130426/12627_1 /TAXON_ID=89044 /ORGANISM="Spumella elongata, Strain CCAP 955/1" /LENGTH=204 /DNA_ID=CAMNT_0027507245 /DNA_START=33 /DNA_END=647 /DNA_ORIENTATION=+
MNEKSTTEESVKLPYELKPFYLNIVLLNKDEIVTAKATEKAGKGLFGRVAAYGATHLVSDEKVLGKISEKLVENVGSAVSVMGIEASLLKVFAQGAYVVIRVQVQEVDKLKLLHKAKGIEFASSFEVLLNSIDKLGLADTAGEKIDRKIKDHIQEGMMKKFGEVIPEKLAENGVSVDCHVVHSTEQAEYFYQMLSDMKEDASAV